MNTPLKFDDERRGAYLLALERSGEVAAASAAVGVSRQTVYKAMRDDPDFADDCERAKGRLLERAMATLKMVAVDGVLEQRFDKEGNLVAEVRKYDVRALLALLKRHLPDQWGDKVQVDQTVKADVTLTDRVAPTDMPREARDKLREALAALRAN